jgi:hypothetical protein
MLDFRNLLYKDQTEWVWKPKVVWTNTDAVLHIEYENSDYIFAYLSYGIW